MTDSPNDSRAQNKRPPSAVRRTSWLPRPLCCFACAPTAQAHCGNQGSSERYQFCPKNSRFKKVAQRQVFPIPSVSDASDNPRFSLKPWRRTLRIKWSSVFDPFSILQISWPYWHGNKGWHCGMVAFYANVKFPFLRYIRTVSRGSSGSWSIVNVATYFMLFVFNAPFFTWLGSSLNSLMWGLSPLKQRFQTLYIENRRIPYRFRVLPRVICERLAGSSKTYSSGSLSVLRRTLCSGAASPRTLPP
jgi:hypothetical protein